jgi:NhaP-type Na+/H+ or K+/H+ antiporter
MGAMAVAVVTATVFLWGLLGARLQRADLTAPIVFISVGALISATFGVPDVEAHDIKVLTEITLVWVLFSNASRVRFQDFRDDVGLYTRLLAVGLPLTIAAGWLLGGLLIPGLDLWLALLVGAALAPTEPTLGVAIMTNPAVPSRIRRLLNVESGLKDGIVTPVVLIAIAGATKNGQGAGVGHAIIELLIGVAIGTAVGLAGGWLMRQARHRGWASEDFAGPAVLALAVLVYAVSIAAHGSGFVAAFVAGLAFGNAAGRRGAEEVRYVEQTGGLVSLLVWLIFGAVVFPILGDALSWQIVLYAVLSLTVLRMAPVALAMLGAHLGRATVLFVGWFGPRGLASIIFALLALERLGAVADTAVAVIAVTVLLSVIVHGVSAGPLLTRYGVAAGTAEEHPSPPQLPRRRGPGPAAPRPHPKSSGEEHM